MSEVKPYTGNYIDENGTVHGDVEVYLSSDFNRVTAERNALQQLLNASDQQVDDAATENNERELSRRDWFDEAQRLQAELHELAGKWERFEEFEHRLQAQLAERDALLREVLQYDQCQRAGDGFNLGGLLQRIQAALSASAEPKCGNCGSSTGQSCNDKGCGYLEAGNGAQVERDERAEFEAYYADLIGLPVKEVESWRKGPDYSISYERCRISWDAWQARAALERKP